MLNIAQLRSFYACLAEAAGSQHCRKRRHGTNHCVCCNPEHSVKPCIIIDFVLCSAMCCELSPILQPAEGSDMPPELLRRFEVVFKPLSKAKPVPMRQIGAEHVGKLVSVKVIVLWCNSTWPANS